MTYNPSATGGASVDAPYIVQSTYTGLTSCRVAANTPTITWDWTTAGNVSINVLKQMSLTADASGLKLSGDMASPGNSKYYGTDSGGTKGFFALPAGGGLTLTTVEKDLGALPLYSGTFDITGLSGLTANKPVLVQQAVGPYTNKGTLQDEAEMDQVSATGYVADATTVRVYWTCPPKAGPLAGNVKFNYAVSA